MNNNNGICNRTGTLGKIVAMLLAIATLAVCVLGLAGCGEESEVPEYMKEARGGEDVGYHFYVPEGWITANYGDIACAYVSSRGMISVSFTEGTLPDSYVKNTDPKTVPEYIKNYVREDIKNLAAAGVGIGEDGSAESKVKPSDGERCDFGNAEEAYSFVLEYTYNSVPVKQLQIFSVYRGRFGIFTYTSYDSEYNDETTYYDRYYNDNGSALGAQSVIKNFRYTNKVSASSPAVTDGYTLISDKTISGFELSVPEGFTVNSASGAVSATRADGTNITVSKATVNVGIMTKEDAATDTTTKDYWRMRIESLEQMIDYRIGDDGKLTSTLSIISERDRMTVGSDAACYFEFTYEMSGEIYHVYMVYIRHAVLLSATDYVYTYTLKSTGNDAWSTEHALEAKDILANHLNF